MNIALELYNLIWNTFFSGDLPQILAGCASELTALMTIIIMAVVIIVPIALVFGFVKWVWNFIRF